MEDELHVLLQRIAVKGGDLATSAYSAPSVNPGRPISYQNQPVSPEKRKRLEELYRKAAHVNGRRIAHFKQVDAGLQRTPMASEQGRTVLVVGLRKGDGQKLALAGCMKLSAAIDHFAVTHNLLLNPSGGQPHAEIPVHAKELLCSFLEKFDFPNDAEMLMLTKALRVSKATIEKFLLAKQEHDKYIREASEMLAVRIYSLHSALVESMD
ncbi:hypothetical protein Slin15195_G039170 [Septoria linicola]|uniref:Uncharacterized protein n=1 Tax=Septoria linicola TaxID=215465 RepID=A0A9Q9EIQ9_9PEZI|nr:hypothetical protein Slin14017_G120590 [Septoria linicola]USW50598.1 hypothetical protein Slin15195_G039170 [Septoria linicola]